jgi:hypothetical protein
MTSHRKTQSLNYYMHDGPNAFRFELAGALTGEDARRVEMDWHTASSVIGARRFVVDLTYIKEIDPIGRDLLLRWQESGAKFAAGTQESKKLVESAVGQCLEVAPEDMVCHTPRRLLPFADLLGYFIPSFRCTRVRGHEEASLRFARSRLRNSHL